MWMKWRHKFAEGPGDWEWTYLGSHPDVDYVAEAKEYAIEFREKYYWNDHYRGVEYELAERPDDDFLKKEIAETAKKIEGQKQYLAMLQGLLNDKE